MNQENNLQVEQPAQINAAKYPAEVRKLGLRAMQIFDTLHQKYLEKGHSHAEAYFYAASRAPEMHRAEIRHTPTRLDPA